LDIDLEVVLKVLPNAGQVDHRGDAEGSEIARVADAGKLEKLR
jgi:hypothetical protein